MKLSELPTIKTKKLRRLGQGHGSGRGKTGGRGTKGTNARGKVSLSFEGGALPLIKRLPFHRGKDKNKSIQGETIIVNVSDLNALPAQTEVTVELLTKLGLIKKSQSKKARFKILGNGILKIPLVVKLSVSKSAQAKIEKAGGSVVSHE